MGGYGSGRRASKHYTVEECRAVDVRRWVRELHLLPGQRVEGRRAWPNAELVYAIDARDATWVHAQLTYRYGQHESAATIAIVWDSPPVGGRRWWLLCPVVGCGRRGAALYALPGRGAWACRHCHGLTYRSAQQSHCYDRSQLAHTL